MHEPESIRIPCVIMRGGTSKGIYFLGNHLPPDPQKRDLAILSVFGSPDARQIDGLGGADPLTSKAAIINPSSRPDADVEYTFGQVDIKSSFIDYSSNCGNISSGVGPFAISQGLVKAESPITVVRIYNTNTNKIFEAEVPVKDGIPLCEGNYQIDGVPGTGAKISLNLAGTVGSKTGRLLPTGNPSDILHIKGIGALEVSMVDAASPMVFVRAHDIGLKGTESPADIDCIPDMLQLLEEIRTEAAVVMGISPDKITARQKIRAVPMIAFVAPPMDYRSHLTGLPIPADSIDFVSRDMFMQIMHKTYSGTATVCTGCAAVTPGTLVHEAMGTSRTSGPIRIGHPGGVIEADMIRDDNGTITRAAIGRTARRIMEGYVYIPYRILYADSVK